MGLQALAASKPSLSRKGGVSLDARREIHGFRRLHRFHRGYLEPIRRVIVCGIERDDRLTQLANQKLLAGKTLWPSASCVD